MLARLPKSQVSLEKERYKDRALFDKNTRILGRLLIFSTPYLLTCIGHHVNTPGGPFVGVMGVGVVFVWSTDLCILVKVVCGQAGAFQSVYVCEYVRGGGGRDSQPFDCL